MGLFLQKLSTKVKGLSLIDHSCFKIETIMSVCVCACICTLGVCLGVCVLLGTGQKDKAETGLRTIGISISEKQYTKLSFSSSQSISVEIT